jgi:hypothetical protein
LLQESQMDVLCKEDSSLTLLTFFGNLQLVGYQNAELGIEQVFANIEIEYKAENVNVLGMELAGALASSPFAGVQEFVDEEGIQLLPGDSSVFIEQFVLNLNSTAGNAFLFTFLADGAGTASQVPCNSTDEFTLVIEA